LVIGQHLIVRSADAKKVERAIKNADRPILQSTAFKSKKSRQSNGDVSPSQGIVPGSDAEDPYVTNTAEQYYDGQHKDYYYYAEANSTCYSSEANGYYWDAGEVAWYWYEYPIAADGSYPLVASACDWQNHQSFYENASNAEHKIDS
jgi:hypothetical protein